MALTLREVCGLTTKEIARAYLVPPATLAQRIVRAKARIRDERLPYEVPAREQLPERLAAVLQVIYLVFNEGYYATSGADLTRPDLSGEALHLGWLLAGLLPEPEVEGLLGLMLLHKARRLARTTPAGDLVLLEDQDRALWDQRRIAAGLARSGGRRCHPPSGLPSRRPAAAAKVGSTGMVTCWLRPSWLQVAGEGVFSELLIVAARDLNEVVRLAGSRRLGKMGNLAELRDRVEALLMDTSNAIWDSNTIDDATREALDEYTAVCPLTVETVIVLPGDGREIALNNLAGLIDVQDAWWPYDSEAAVETWPPNRVRGWRVYWDDAQPVLFLDILVGAQPQQNDEMRIWYSRRQTIQDLDSADATTLQPDHESHLVKGAAGHCALSRTVDLVEVVGTDLYAIGLLGTWGRAKEREWSSFLESLRRKNARRGVPWGAGWKLDQWDE